MNEVEPFVLSGCNEVAAEQVEIGLADLVFMGTAGVPGSQPLAANWVWRLQKVQLMAAIRLIDQMAHPAPDGGRVSLKV